VTAARRFAPASPTGEQWALVHGDQAAVVTEVGATLRAYRVGADVLDGFGPGEWAQGGRGQVLCPWPNRLGDGRYRFGGVTAQAALDEPERRCAIHGLVRWMAWEQRERTASSVVAGCRLHPTPGYPFSLSLSVEYRLSGEGLSVTTTATNLGDVPLPFGLGFHPYLLAGAGRIDSCTLRLPATEELVLDERGLPTGERRPVAGTGRDFQSARLIGDTRMDSALSGLRRGPDGRARAVLEDPASAQRVELWADEHFPFLMCFTGDTLAEESRRRRSVAIEPMTCPPDAFRSGDDLVVLPPGGSWTGVWGLQPGP
jgi:galactose mutarotase-like enzyme